MTRQVHRYLYYIVRALILLIHIVWPIAVLGDRIGLLPRRSVIDGRQFTLWLWLQILLIYKHLDLNWFSYLHSTYFLFYNYKSMCNTYLRSICVEIKSKSPRVYDRTNRSFISNYLHVRTLEILLISLREPGA